MTTTTYVYETRKGKNVETFTSNGYVTLYQDGIFKYEYHFGSKNIQFKEYLLRCELEQRGINYQKTII